MEYIVEYLQKGGTISRSKIYRTRTQSKSVLKQNLLKEFEGLGWNRRFLERTFYNLKDTIIADWPNRLFIEEWAKQMIQEHDSIQQSLEYIGIHHRVAQYCETICSRLIQSSYSKKHILDIAIEYLVGKYDPLTSPTTTHYRHRTILNKWFYDDILKINILNVPAKCSLHLSQQITSFLYKIPNHNPNESNLHFHTTSWRNCLNILVEIDNKIGRRCLDFGTKPGFYCSQTIQDSLDFGFKKRDVFHNEVAIIIFSLPKIFPNTIALKRLEEKEWESIVRMSRQCLEPNVELSPLRGYDMIFGNMAYNVSDIKEGITPIPHTPPKTQLCSKKEKGDIFLQEHIIGILFFQKYIPLNTSKNITRKLTSRSSIL